MKEQIEEMAKIIAVQRGYDCASRESCDESCIVYRCNPYAYAEIIYNAGYRKQSEWISVEDRLPKDDCFCLCYGYWTDDGTIGIYICLYSCDKWTTWSDFVVTHWMPLPEPPKMKGGAE